MAELAAEAAFEGAGLPLAAGGTTLAALPEVARVSVAPFAGQREAVATALGTLLPEPGRAAGGVLWAGLGLWLVEGRQAGEVSRRLAGLAAVTDQSDGWAGLRLTGATAVDVLARLVPLDLAGFGPGSAARSLLHHVPLLILSVPAGFDLLVPRSYARTALGEIAQAMRAAAARAALRVD